MRLSQKVALVTSSRRGVCASTARLLAQAGASVMICGRNATQGQATVTEIQSSGGRASFILADIASATDVQAAIDETIATYGRLDILFNCASSPHPHDSTLTTVSEAAWDRIVEVTLKGTFFCCQYALPFLQNAGSGIIINFIEQSEEPQAQAVAGICHGGILSMTQAIAHQFSTHRVAANLIWCSSQPSPSAPITSEKVIYAPLDPSDSPFAEVTDAILYLATCEPQIYGYTLVVSEA
mgnify:CR=1 FL=1